MLHPYLYELLHMTEEQLRQVEPYVILKYITKAADYITRAQDPGSTRQETFAVLLFLYWAYEVAGS